MWRRIWEGWKRFGMFLGDIIARIFLTLFYFTIFLPFGLITRLFSDPLKIKTRPVKLWLDRRTTDLSLDDARRQS